MPAEIKVRPAKDSHSLPSIQEIIAAYTALSDKPAFTREGETALFDVYLAFYVETGEAFIVDSREYPHGLDAEELEELEAYGKTRLWKIDPAITKRDLATALRALHPTIEAVRAGTTLYREDDGELRARLSDEAAAIEAGVGTIGRRA